jgi:hypothetical protein
MSENEPEVKMVYAFTSSPDLLMKGGRYFKIPIGTTNGSKISKITFSTPKTNFDYVIYMICMNVPSLNKKILSFPRNHSQVFPKEIEQFVLNKNSDNTTVKVFCSFSAQDQSTKTTLSINRNGDVVKNLSDYKAVEEAQNRYKALINEKKTKVPLDVWKKNVRKNLSRVTLSDLHKLRENKGLYLKTTNSNNSTEELIIERPSENLRDYNQKEFNVKSVYWNLVHLLLSDYKYSNDIFMKTKSIYNISIDEHKLLLNTIEKFKENVGDLKYLEMAAFAIHNLQDREIEQANMMMSPEGFVKFPLSFKK